MENNILTHAELTSVFIYTFVVFIFLVIILILFFYFTRKKIIKQEQEKNELKIINQKKLLRSIIVTQENERTRIAQDLHDDISSKLNVVSLNAHLLYDNKVNEQEKINITKNIIEYTKNALDSSRRIAHDLMPPVLEKFGLHAGIEELVNEYNSTKKIKVTYTNQLSLDKIDIDNQLNVFRILQELLNNSVKHGKATEAKISFLIEKNKNFCYYSDNGIGFDVQSSNGNGIGLKNIQSRIDFYSGNMNIISSPGKGCRIELTIPV